MKHTIYIIIGVAMLLFASCGRQQQAKSVVKEFMEKQLHKDVSYIDFSSVDSTHALSDSMILVLQQRGPKGLQYRERKGATLLHIRAKYQQESDTCSITFYLDSEAQGVVAFKEN